MPIELTQPFALPPVASRLPDTPAAPLNRWARRLCNRVLAASSLVANEPVLDMRDFAWTANLRAGWRAIAAEARRAIADGAIILWQEGVVWDTATARCPATARALARVPGLVGAHFAVLPAGAHEPARCGITKGLITCQLGLAVPRDGDVRMRIDDRMVRWAEGETLVFDDSYDHESWNDSAAERVVLTLQFARPLRNPGKWVADHFPRLLRRSIRPKESGPPAVPHRLAA